MGKRQQTPEAAGRRYARESLGGLVESMIEEHYAFPAREPTLLDATCLPWEVSMEVSLNFHAGLWAEADPEERDRVAQRVWAHHERLEAYLSNPTVFHRGLVESKEHLIKMMAYYIALIVVPCYTHLGRYPQALRIVECFFGLSRSREFLEVAAAGSRGMGIEYRHVLLTPVFWSLAIHYPF